MDFFTLGQCTAEYPGSAVSSLHSVVDWMRDSPEPACPPACSEEVRTLNSRWPHPKQAIIHYEWDVMRLKSPQPIITKATACIIVSLSLIIISACQFNWCFSLIIISSTNSNEPWPFQAFINVQKWRNLACGFLG